MIDNAKLYELLGLSASAVEDWSSTKRNAASIAVPCSDDQYKFMPRKNHPLAKRFELARFLGDHLLAGQTNEQWLASTDLSTARQKYQRAFAAEFLCPIAALQEFLQDDYSEDTIEEAGQHFQVSNKIVDSLLVNNGLVPPPYMTDYAEARLPYRLGI